MQLLQKHQELKERGGRIMAQREKKVMDAIQAMSLRNLVSQINALGLQKEDILQVLSNEEGFFLLYYK